jgi:4-hydroxy-3-methylbut-2-enyl diphosphate reductase
VTKPAISILLANPRGFCAGVERAIKIVETAIEKYGAPVYVRHEIVHNRYVVESLENKGAIFVEELDEVPDNVPVIFSAHGVPKSVPIEAKRRQLLYVDATCPLVSKVHREAQRHFKTKHHIIMIGHKGHPEVIGTMGQLPKGAMTLVETPEDVEKLSFGSESSIAYTTQTTLSLDDTADIIAALKAKFPSIQNPKKEDICYATTNRQQAVKAIAAKVDRTLVIGAPNSSNSMRLAEVSNKLGTKAKLIQRANDINWGWLKGATSLGITAGASAPEILVEEVIEAIKTRYKVTLEVESVAKENITFKLPPILKAAG